MQLHELKFSCTWKEGFYAISYGFNPTPARELPIKEYAAPILEALDFIVNQTYSRRLPPRKEAAMGTPEIWYSNSDQPGITILDQVTIGMKPEIYNDLRNQSLVHMRLVHNERNPDLLFGVYDSVMSIKGLEVSRGAMLQRSIIDHIRLVGYGIYMDQITARLS